MEVEFPFRPTFEPTQRRAAVCAYVTGERLCDAGNHAAGIKKLKEAQVLAWELSWERWPSWAEAIHAEMTGGTPTSQTGRPFDSTWAPSVSLLPREPAEAWWRAPAQTIADELCRRNVVVLDHFAGEVLAGLAREEAARASAEGLLEPARVRNADNPATHTGSAATRSDRLCWASLDEERWAAVGKVNQRTDGLIACLRSCVCPPLAGIKGRERVMVAAYGHGDAFARHSDNHCIGGNGPHCNPRVLTAVYYMSPDDWQPAMHGGCLRLYKPLDAGNVAYHSVGHDGRREEGDHDGNRGGDEDGDEDGDVLLEVAPVADRLVLFLSDLRCPHEVLAIKRADGAERYSAITWYCTETSAAIV